MNCVAAYGIEDLRRRPQPALGAAGMHRASRGRRRTGCARPTPRSPPRTPPAAPSAPRCSDRAPGSPRPPPPRRARRRRTRCRRRRQPAERQVAASQSISLTSSIVFQPAGAAGPEARADRREATLDVHGSKLHVCTTAPEAERAAARSARPGSARCPGRLTSIAELWRGSGAIAECTPGAGLSPRSAFSPTENRVRATARPAARSRSGND
jgi:hypothetical protein